MKRHPIVEEDLAGIVSSPLPWAELDGTNVLISGGSGLVAAYLAETLLYRNEQASATLMRVHLMVRDEERAHRRFAAYTGREDLRFIVQDVCAPPPERLRVDYIIHAASPATPRHFRTDPAGTLGPNIFGTHHLLELARRSSSRGFVFLSSGEVYGQFPASPGRPIAETDFGTLDPLDPRASYAESKRAGEMMCQAWHRQFGLRASIARLGHTYGPGVDLADGRVFADFVASLVRGEDFELKSDGLASRPFCYLSDAAVGILLVLLRGAGGTAYHVVNDEAETRIIDLAHRLTRVFPEKRLQVRVPAGTPPSSASSASAGVPVDTSRLRRLGWSPRVNVEEGFRRTALSFFLPA